MVKVHNLVVKYKQFRAINSITFNIDKGEIVAIAGKNGAGKSSLLKAIVGLSPIASGSVELTKSVGWMPEGGVPDPKLTVSEFLAFSAYLKGSGEVDDLISSCGLSAYRDSFCGTLSKGLKQRVLFASALIGNPDVVVLDEPSAGLDPLFQEEMQNLIASQSQNRTIILSTHNISEINNLASRVIVLRDGLISYDGDSTGNKFYEYL